MISYYQDQLFHYIFACGMRKLGVSLAVLLSLVASNTYAAHHAESEKTTSNKHSHESAKVSEKTKTAEAVEIVLETSEGNITLKTMPKQSPITAANFVEYVKAGFYDNTVFHRVIPGFVVQGGGFDAQLTRKTTRSPIRNESNNGILNNTMTLSMARTNDPDSATSQFFINLKDNTSLDYKPNRPGYAVFAKVTDGVEVVRKIERMPRGQVPGFREAPNSLPSIKRAYIKTP